MRGRILVPGAGEGPLLRLSAPISFWGGVDPRTGRVADPRHPEHGAALGGTVLVVPAAVGSSSSSAILLELVRGGVAPAAILMGRADAILALGVVVAQELGYPPLPVLELEEEATQALAPGTRVRVSVDGEVSVFRGAPPPTTFGG